MLKKGEEMKKRILVIVLVTLLLCCVLALCLYALAPDPIYADFEEKSATLIVNGTTLDVDGVYVYDGLEFRYPDNAFIPVPLIYPTSYAKLPLVATLTALGVQVEWQDESIATLTLEDKTLVLDLKKQTVTEQGKDDTWVHYAAGSFVCVRETAYGDLLVDGTSMDEVLFYFFGNQTPTFTVFDWESGTVTVTVQKITE